jgi:hypothetical protein
MTDRHPRAIRRHGQGDRGVRQVKGARRAAQTPQRPPGGAHAPAAAPGRQRGRGQAGEARQRVDHAVGLDAGELPVRSAAEKPAIGVRRQREHRAVMHPDASEGWRRRARGHEFHAAALARPQDRPTLPGKPCDRERAIR